MTVADICRVLYGSLHLRAYDWVTDKPVKVGAQGYAREARDQVRILNCPYGGALYHMLADGSILSASISAAAGADWG